VCSVLIKEVLSVALSAAHEVQLRSKAGATRVTRLTASTATCQALAQQQADV
jgi:hypothetical protein